MVRKAKTLITIYYGRPARYSYWNGCSTGGGQGLMAVQRFPEEYDGLVIAAHAINWDRFIPAELWPQIVMREELGGPNLRPQAAHILRGRQHLYARRIIPRSQGQFLQIHQ
jgi:hypothetical protein